MQSYNGTIRLFPNWPKNEDAAFQNLRGAGAFLISAKQQKGNVTFLTVYSEKGNDLKLIVPWGAQGTITNKSGKKAISTSIVTLKTRRGELISFSPF